MTMPTIRPARFGDIPALVRLIGTALDASAYAEIARLDEAALKGVLAHFIQCQHGAEMPALVAVADTGDRLEGVIVATCRPIYEVLSARCVSDLIWFAAPGAHARTGIRLLRAMHRWAEGLPNVAMIRQQTSSAISDPALTGRILEKAGMRRVGAAYERKLRP